MESTPVWFLAAALWYLASLQCKELVYAILPCCYMGICCAMGVKRLFERMVE